METIGITGISSSFLIKDPASSLARPWTQEEIALLKTLVSQNTPKFIIAKELERSVHAINHKAAEIQ